MEKKTVCIEAFIKASKLLAPLSENNVLVIAERLAVSPELFALLLKIAANGGGLYEN